MRGGVRPNAGRKAGSVNKRTIAHKELAARAAAEGESPLEFMLRVMRTSDDESQRFEAAKAAAPYVHPRLAAVEHSGDKDNPIHQSTRVEMVMIDAAGNADDTSSDTPQARPSH